MKIKHFLLGVFCLFTLNTQGQVLVEVLGASGCYFCPFAVKSAEEIAGNTIIVYWYQDKTGEEYIRSRRKHYNIYVYPTTWFNGRDWFVGGGDGVMSVTRDFQQAYNRVKDDPKRYDISISEKNGQINVELNGKGGYFWFVINQDFSHKPAFIDTLQLNEGYYNYIYQIKPGDREIIAWVEDRLGTMNVQKYVRDISSAESIEDKEIEVKDGYINFKEKLIIYDLVGKKIGEYVKPVPTYLLPNGMVILKTARKTTFYFVNK